MGNQDSIAKFYQCQQVSRMIATMNCAYIPRNGSFMHRFLFPSILIYEMIFSG